MCSQVNPSFSPIDHPPSESHASFLTSAFLFSPAPKSQWARGLLPSSLSTSSDLVQSALPLYGPASAAPFSTPLQPGCVKLSSSLTRSAFISMCKFFSHHSQANFPPSLLYCFTSLLRSPPQLPIAKWMKFKGFSLALEGLRIWPQVTWPNLPSPAITRKPSALPDRCLNASCGGDYVHI